MQGKKRCRNTAEDIHPPTIDFPFNIIRRPNPPAAAGSSAAASPANVDHALYYNVTKLTIKENKDNFTRDWQGTPDAWIRQGNDAEQITTDDNLRNHLIHTVVQKNVLHRTDTVLNAGFENYFLLKWYEAVKLENECGFTITGAANMVNTYNILKPAIDYIRDNKEFYKNQFNKIMINSLKFKSDEMKNVIFKNSSDFKNYLTQLKADKNQVETVLHLENKIYVLTPLAVNALRETFEFIDQVLKEEGVDVSEFIRETDDEYVSEFFKMKRKDLILLFSRHPIIADATNKAAGAILQSSLNLRNGVYTGIRQMNANENRVIGSILLLKSRVRKVAADIGALMVEITANPANYLQYFINIEDTLFARTSIMMKQSTANRGFFGSEFPSFEPVDSDENQSSLDGLPDEAPSSAVASDMGSEMNLEAPVNESRQSSGRYIKINGEIVPIDSFIRNAI